MQGKLTRQYITQSNVSFNLSLNDTQKHLQDMIQTFPCVAACLSAFLVKAVPNYEVEYLCLYTKMLLENQHEHLQ